MNNTAHAAIDAVLSDADTMAEAAPRPVSNADIEKHLALVHQVVARFVRKLPASVDRGDLVSAGMFGLVRSLERNGGDAGETFEGYARMRIRGAILDELRAQDWLSRRARSAARVQGDGYVGPTTQVGIDDLSAGEQAWRFADASSGDALEALEALGTRQELEAAVARLPERERTVISQHYFEGVRFKDISKLLGVSEPRVSQLHTRALARLREGLAREAA